MCTIRIDSHSKTIREIELRVNPNRSMSVPCLIIGYEPFQLILLIQDTNLLSGVDDETKASFGFYLFDEPVIYGGAVVLGSIPRRGSRLHESTDSFGAFVVWKDKGERAFSLSCE